MTFEQGFDFWIAKKFNDLLGEGYTFEQAKKLMEMLYGEFYDLIDDKILVYWIKRKFETTINLFERVENESSN